MTWDVMQQVVRIVLYIVSGVFTTLGLVVPDMVMTSIAGLVTGAGTIAWWTYWQYFRKETPPDGPPLEEPVPVEPAPVA
jgi:hypothetical protein